MSDETDAPLEPFQVMPPLATDEYESLKREIEEFGVLVPVVKDQHGRILDGHHRKRIADELGVKYRVDVVQVADDEQARTLARTYNLARRHLSRDQKRRLIADEIEADPNRSDREIGRLMGCDHKTVGSVRRDLAAGELPHPDDEWTEFTLTHWRSLQPHPANACLPDMTDVEFDGLVSSITSMGMIHPVVLDEQGLILDGRQRLRACAKADVEPRFRMYRGADQVEFVVSMNLIRKHAAGGELPHAEPLTETERAMLARAEETIAAATGRVDMAIMYALTKDIDPATIIKWIYSARVHIDQLDQPREVLDLMLRVIDERIRFVREDGQTFAEQHRGGDEHRLPLTTDEVARLAHTISGGTE